MKAQNYNYFIVNIGEKKEQAYQAIVPKFPNLHIFLDPIDNMHEIVMEAISNEIKDRKKHGKRLPEPDVKPILDFKGKIILRTTPELHERLYYLAQSNKLSLNKYIESKLDKDTQKLSKIKFNDLPSEKNWNAIQSKVK